MTPSLAQRLGLEPIELEPDLRRTLIAARAGAICFVALAALVFAAAAIGHDLRAPALAAVGASAALALVLVCCFERLGRSVNRLIALSGMVFIAELTFFQPAGEIYAPLYFGIVIYVSFFFSRRQALVQLLVAAGLWAILAGRVHPVGDAVQTWILGAGTLAAAAAMTGTMRDRLLHAAARARTHRNTLDAYFQHAPAGFGVLDCDLRLERLNQALAEIIGHERHEIVGRTLRELAPLNADVLEPLARSVIERGEPVIGIEIENAAGKCHLVSYYPVPGPHGIVGVGTAVADVTHLKAVERNLEETNRKLMVLATTDELTQLPNRRLFGEQLDIALARARRGGLAVAVLCLDLDGFKDVNDTLGHGYGDRVLVAVAAVLRAGARETDVVARVGGDEFLIMLSDLDVQEAPECAETVIDRIRDLLADPLPVDAVEVRIHASVGVAIFPTDSREAGGLLAAADAAMYMGKHALTRVA